jgi:predicted amidophosphoribosyltransferase
VSRHLPEVEAHWSSVWPFTPPTPAAKRCGYCGESWPRAGEVCDAKCAASLAEQAAVFAAGSIDDRVEDAMRDAAEHEAEAREWTIGRDFGRGL